MCLEEVGKADHLFYHCKVVGFFGTTSLTFSFVCMNMTSSFWDLFRRVVFRVF